MATITTVEEVATSQVVGTLLTELSSEMEQATPILDWPNAIGVWSPFLPLFGTDNFSFKHYTRKEHPSNSPLLARSLSTPEVNSSEQDLPATKSLWMTMTSSSSTTGLMDWATRIVSRSSPMRTRRKSSTTRGEQMMVWWS